MVVDLEVVDKRETGGKSAAMEKLALARLLKRVKEVLRLSNLVTDASTSIRALVRDMKGMMVQWHCIVITYKCYYLFSTMGRIRGWE